MSTIGDTSGWDEDPAPHSKWLRLLQGKEPCVPQKFAEVLWFWYIDAMDQLRTLTSSGEEEKVTTKAGEQSKSSTYDRVVEELNWMIKRFETLLQNRQMPAAPESLFPTEEWLSAESSHRFTFGISISAYCIWCIDRCISSLLEGDFQLAITTCAYAGDALRISEAQCVALGRSPLSQLALSQNARSGADKSHVENRRMKAEVFEWLDLNMRSFRSMDGAAENISQRVVPVKFRTARDWITDWKRLRSASKP